MTPRHPDVVVEAGLMTQVLSSQEIERVKYGWLPV